MCFLKETELSSTHTFSFPTRVIGIKCMHTFIHDLRTLLLVFICDIIHACLYIFLYRLSASDMQQKIKELGLLDPLLKHPQEVR